MAFSVILISSNSSEVSVGRSTARVILFGTIPTTIPPTTPTTDLPAIHDDTLLTPTISPTIPTIPPVAPIIQYTSLFIDTGSSNNDTPDSPPLQDPYEAVVAWIIDSNSVTNLEDSSEDGYEPYVPRETGLGIDVEDSYEPYTEPDISFNIQATIDECLRMWMLLKLYGRMIEMWLRLRPRKREDVHDHVKANGAVEVTYETLGDLGYRIIEVDFEVTTMTERIDTNMLTATCTRMTQDAINELISMRVDEALKVYDDARNPRIEAESKNDQQDDHVEENDNNWNGNKNGNGNPNVNNISVVPVARECTYQDFVKCQPLNFKGTEGVVGLTRWFEKMETVFHISNCPSRYQVKYASCTLIDGALTWWNSHKMIKPLRVRALMITIGLNLPKQILNAQAKARKEENYITKDLHGMINKLEPRADEKLCLNNMSWIPCYVTLEHIRRKPLEFQVGDKVMLKVSPWKRVILFRKRRKLNPRYIRPFKILAKVETVAYRLELPEQLSRVHSKFYVSNLKKCPSDKTLAISLDEIQVDNKLHFIEEPVKIMGREVKCLKQNHISIIKVLWNSRKGPEFTWEREDQMQKKYPHLFANSTPVAEVTS
nr:putative reverse transcriptase domain-containing protein [Tanacetum cinerariifolium]